MNKKAILAGGCFWGMEELFRKLKGIQNTDVGYTGGENHNPTYQNHPGHAEAIELTYDSEIISYQEILDFFFTIHDPTTLNRQGNDLGSAYRSAIFYQDELEKQEAASFIELVNHSNKWKNPVKTRLEPFNVFYHAEDFHQNYLQNTPNGYTCHYQRFESYF